MWLGRAPNRPPYFRNCCCLSRITDKIYTAASGTTHLAQRGIVFALFILERSRVLRFQLGNSCHKHGTTSQSARRVDVRGMRDNCPVSCNLYALAGHSGKFHRDAETTPTAVVCARVQRQGNDHRLEARRFRLTTKRVAISGDLPTGRTVMTRTNDCTVVPDVVHTVHQFTDCIACIPVSTRQQKDGERNNNTNI